jgi:glycosyltransferase involved in cell wall biosynthesis
MESILEILPALTHEEVAEQMRRADCFVLFSDFENQPCVLAEAMASGLPFISTRVGGVEEFIVDKSCMMIERGNINQLVESMAAMIQGRISPNRDELVEYAKSNFSPVPISQKINKIYNDCLNMI